jgi:serine/threonine protein kinase
VNRSAGPFEITEILGEGSFGTVCVARVTSDPLRRQVALKILKDVYAKNKKILNRTRDEARLLSSIDHPNVVRVEQLMEIGGRPVVVMEHVEGVSLDQLLVRFKDGLPATVALEVVRHTCLALHAAYGEALGEDGRPLRVIHRDVKPSNIMLSVRGEVKVLDFGIARGEFEGREARTESVVMGSRPYMAPERLDGVSDNHSVDVYSSGMTLYELLTGRTMGLSINPIHHDQAKTRQLRFVRVAGMPSAAVEDLRDLVGRMCAYSRDYRPSAAECARDIEQLVYAIDRSCHIHLEEFARTAVAPIHASRKRDLPADTMSSGDDDLLSEVTGALTAPTSPGHVRRMALAPYLFAGVLGLVVMLLCALAVTKALLTVGGFAFGDSVAVAVEEAAEEGLVKVDLWFPQDAHASVGDQLLEATGSAHVVPGPAEVQLQFDNGHRVHCPFVASDSATVRWVGDDQISVDDGLAIGCSVPLGAR